MEDARPRKPIRANTFCIDYEGMPRRPSRKEVIDFIVDKLGLGDKIEAIQNCSSRGRVFVQMETAEQAREVVEANGNKHAITIDGKTYTIPLILEDGTMEVRLLELPSYITHEDIRKEMAKLGEVASIYDERYGVETRVPGVLTGVRTVRLIPFTAKMKLGPTLTIAGERTPIKYPGQEAYCKYCLVPEHMGRTCAQTKRESYADMAKRTSAPIPPPLTAQKTPASKTTAPNQPQKGKKVNVSRPVHTSMAQIRLDLARRNNLSHEKDAEGSWTTLQSEKKFAQTPLEPPSQPSPKSETKTPSSIVPGTSTPVMEMESTTETFVKPSSSACDTTEMTKMPPSITAAASEKACVAADTGRYRANAPGRKTDLVKEVLGRYDTASEVFKVPRDRSPPVKLPPSKPGEATESDTGSVSSGGSTRGRGRPRKNPTNAVPQVPKEEKGKESGAMET